MAWWSFITASSSSHSSPSSLLVLFDLPLSLRSVISASESTVLFFLNLHLDRAYNSKLANKWHKNTKVLTDSGITIRLIVWFNGRWTIFMTCKYCEKAIDQSGIKCLLLTSDLFQFPLAIILPYCCILVPQTYVYIIKKSMGQEPSNIPFLPLLPDSCFGRSTSIWSFSNTSGKDWINKCPCINVLTRSWHRPCRDYCYFATTASAVSPASSSTLTPSMGTHSCFFQLCQVRFCCLVIQLGCEVASE